jgi:hypothetical protein
MVYAAKLEMLTVTENAVTENVVVRFVVANINNVIQITILV